MKRIKVVVYAVATTVGVMFASGTYLMLQRDIVRVVWGVILMSQAANVYLVTMGGIGGKAPIVDGKEATGSYTDPLVQALVLTAIVISFGVTAFALVLTYRFYENHGSLDLFEFGRGWQEGWEERTGRDIGTEEREHGGDEG